MKGRATYIIAYDIVHTKRRTKIAKIMLKAGWARIQYSVWMRQTTRSGLEALLLQLDHIAPQELEDSILVFSLPPGLIPICRDNNRINYYLSEYLEHIYI